VCDSYASAALGPARQLSIPPVVFGRGPSHEVQAQRQKVRAAEILLADTRELLGLEIDRSWDELQAASATVRVAEAAVEQAEVNPDEESDRLVLRPKVRDVAR